MKVIYVYLLILVSISFHANAIKLAIIGGGIGGSSLAYYLSTYENLEITIFEEKKSMGGRISTKNFNNTYIERGAHFFIPQNELLVSLIKEFNLTYQLAKDDNDNSIGLWDGKKIYFELGNYSFMNILNLFWRYGYSMVKSKIIYGENFMKFFKIYDKLGGTNKKKKVKTFKNLKSLLKGCKLLKLIEMTIEEYFTKIELSKGFSNEFFKSILVSLYNQDKSINAFAGFIILAAIFNEPHVIKGGNKKLIKRMLINTSKRMKNNLTILKNNVVLEVEKLENKKFKIKYRKNYNNKLETEKISEFEEQIFDVVVFANPVSKSNVKFINFPEIDPYQIQPDMYKKTVINYVIGTLNSTYFNISSSEHIPRVILCNKIKNRIFSEIVRKCSNCAQFKNDTSNNTYDLYHLQSSVVIPKEELDKIFEVYEVNEVHVWENAYPILSTVKIDELPKFEIFKNLYHINAIEAAASCMEMILISSKNIANLIAKKFFKVKDKSRKKDKKKKDKKKKKSKSKKSKGKQKKDDVGSKTEF